MSGGKNLLCGWIAAWIVFFSGHSIAKPRTFKVTLRKAKISATKANKMNWDSGFGKTRLPDVYVLLTFGKQQFRSRVVRNSLSPVWNQTWVVTVDPRKVTPFVVLRDKDLKLDDPIGQGEMSWAPQQRLFLGQAELLEVQLTDIASQATSSAPKKASSKPVSRKRMPSNHKASTKPATNPSR